MPLCSPDADNGASVGRQWPIEIMTVYDLVARLPEPRVLRDRARAFAVLDVMFAADYRTHLFDRDWGGPGIALAAMDSGGGDNYGIVFDHNGAFLYGFDHESPITPWRDDIREHWPHLLDGLPAVFEPYTREPAFVFEDFFDATVCAWWLNERPGWRHGPVDFADVGPQYADPDGANFLFEIIADGRAEAYAAWAQDYFERPVDRDAVGTVLAGGAVTPEIVGTLNPEADFPSIAREVAAMGHPIGA
jgi:hypothetical protein